MMMTDEEKRITAYHEAGHALVAAFTPGADPLHKVTIIPRGRALGLTMQLPTEDKYTYRKQYVEAQIAILMGGRIAEELIQDEITTGAGNDIERATEHGPPDGLRVGHVASSGRSPSATRTSRSSSAASSPSAPTTARTRRSRSTARSRRIVRHGLRAAPTRS